MHTPFFTPTTMKTKPDTTTTEYASAINNRVLQLKPDIGFNVNNLNRERGRMADPFDDGTNISFPVSFEQSAPLEANAEVEVTGAEGDDCSAVDVGFLQTVHSQWLHIYYWGRSAGHGSIIERYTCPLPIRDGDSGTFWYADSAHAAPSGCNATVNPSMSDTPIMSSVVKVQQNSVTGQDNFLTGIIRGIHFVTTLVAVVDGNVRPLKHFYWNFWMDLRFRPNYTSPTDAWSFEWRVNRSTIGGLINGGSRSIPIFTTPTSPYNDEISGVAIERP